MYNFVFHNPVKVIFGRDTLRHTGPECAALGRRVLLVYGQGSIRANGAYAQVRASLEAAGLDVAEHPGVRSNPVLSHTREGIALAKRHRADLVLAVGGGSVIDEAKAICAGAMVEHDVWKFFTGKRSIKAALPLVTVLTLAASGSEMNQGMVITNEETREKFGTGNRHLHPRVSILDPALTCSVPRDYTAYGAVDAISHVLEFYMTREADPAVVQERLMEGIVMAVMDACDRCLADPRDYQARADLMWGATLALNGLTAAGLGRVGFPMHMVEHSLSALYDVPHGAGLAVVIPAWLDWFSRENPARVAALGQRVLGVDGGDGEQDAAARTVAALRALFREWGCPLRLAELGADAADIPAIAANALGLARVWRLDYGQEDIEEILRRAI